MEDILLRYLKTLPPRALRRLRALALAIGFGCSLIGFAHVERCYASFQAIAQSTQASAQDYKDAEQDRRLQKLEDMRVAERLAVIEWQNWAVIGIFLSALGAAGAWFGANLLRTVARTSISEKP
jgi:hypothetical protein